MTVHALTRRVLSVRPVIASLWVFLGILLVPAARADLAVSGGTPTQQQQLRQVFAALPACCHTSCPVSVRLLTDQAMDACLQASAAAQAMRLINAAAVDGFYQDSSKAITLRVSAPAADVSAPFAHEYGHYVWMNVLSPAQRDQYRKIYATQRLAHCLVSPYAAVSVAEGFAEAFSFYVRDCSCLAGRDSLSCCFLSETLRAVNRR